MGLPASYLDEFIAPDGYLDFASIGPPSRRAAAALQTGYATLSAAGEKLAPGMFEAAESTIRAVGRLIGTPEEQVVLIHSTSEGLFSASFGLGRGGNVVVPETEFPANLYPWIRAAERGGPEPRFVPVPDGRVTPDVLAPHVDAATVAIAVSLVDYLTGFRVDPEGLRELAGERLLVIDGIQGVGAVTAPFAPADVLVVGAQKWLRAGVGVGFMAMSARALGRLDTSLVGWTGVEDFMSTEVPPPHPPQGGAGRFQLGSAPMTLAPALGAALEVLNEAGTASVEAEVLDRSRRLEEAARRAGAEVMAPWRTDRERSGIVSFRMESLPAEVVVEAMAASGITASLWGGRWVRMAPHATTPPDVADEVAEILSGLKTI